MVVMPVSIASTGVGAFNRTNFTGRNERNDSEEVINNQVAKPSNLAKVPVVVMIAMSPAMLNAKAPVTGLAGTEGAKTELVTVLPSSMEEIGEMTTIAPGFSAPEVKQSNPPLGITELRGQKIQYMDSFTRNGKKYNVVFSTMDYDNNEVRSVLMFPQGYKSNPSKYQIPYIYEIVYHDLGPEKEFCGVMVADSYKGKDGTWYEVLEEVKIPERIGQKIIDLIANQSKWHNLTGIKFSSTTSEKLRDKTTL